MKLPAAGALMLPELCSGQENLGAAGPLATPNGFVWLCEAVVLSAVNAALRGSPGWAAVALGVGGSEAADPEPDAPEPKKVVAAAEGAAGSALVNGAAKGATGAEPVEGAAAGSAAEAEAVLQLSAVGALAAELNVHPLVPKMGAADWLP